MIALVARAETMAFFLQMLEERYGGVNGYLMDYVGLSEADLAIIRHTIAS
jgi:hypothetical protein